jgi:hypothetical protein
VLVTPKKLPLVNGIKVEAHDAQERRSSKTSLPTATCA